MNYVIKTSVKDFVKDFEIFVKDVVPQMLLPLCKTSDH